MTLLVGWPGSKAEVVGGGTTVVGEEWGRQGLWCTTRCPPFQVLEVKRIKQVARVALMVANLILHQFEKLPHADALPNLATSQL